MPRRPAANPLLALCAALLALAIACRPSATATPSGASYFPLELGARWLYETTFRGPSTRTSMTVVAVCRIRDSAREGQMFLVATCGETPASAGQPASTELLQGQFLVRDGSRLLEPLLVGQDGQPRPRDPPDVIGRTDLRVGQTWLWQGEIGDEERTTEYRVANRGRVLTPAGEFDAVRLLVTDRSGGPRSAVERWYAPGIGLVRESGIAEVPVQGGRAGVIELVRTLREYGVVGVEVIPCCQRIPGGVGG